MARSIGILNYIGLLMLYIICFIFIYKKYTEILGFIILIVINFAVLLYVTNDVIKILETSYYFVQLVACSSIVIGLTFQSVVLIFILMIINNLQTKFKKINDLPFTLPIKYRERLDFIKALMITSFSIGCIILYNLYYYNIEMSYSFYLIMVKFELKYLIEKRLLFITLLLSIILITISSYEVYIGNTFLLLSRQTLMDMKKE